MELLVEADEEDDEEDLDFLTLPRSQDIVCFQCEERESEGCVGQMECGACLDEELPHFSSLTDQRGVYFTNAKLDSSLLFEES